jgi:hypothetical protein
MQRIVRRSVGEEAAAFAEAKKTFRLIERESALKSTGFSRDELWEAVFLGHRQDATSIPIAPPDGIDIRPYLYGKTIEAFDRHVMHGVHPAAIVSMFTPPQPFITADALRMLSINGGLNFRHTIISEFIYPDQSKGIKRLDRRIRQVMRSTQSVSGRHRLSPEASVALQDPGVDLFDRQRVSSPLALALAAPRGGKSVLLGRFINHVLATKAHARVPAADTLAEDILTTLVNEVYRNEVPRNRPGLPKHEPRLSHLIDYLSTWPFKGAALDRAEELKLALGQFRAQTERNVSTITNRAMDVAEGGVGLMGGMAGKSLPLVYAMRDSAQKESIPLTDSISNQTNSTLPER